MFCYLRGSKKKWQKWVSNTVDSCLLQASAWLLGFSIELLTQGGNVCARNLCCMPGQVTCMAVLLYNIVTCTGQAGEVASAMWLTHHATVGLGTMWELPMLCFYPFGSGSMTLTLSIQRCYYQQWSEKWKSLVIIYCRRKIGTGGKNRIYIKVYMAIKYFVHERKCSAENNLNFFSTRHNGSTFARDIQMCNFLFLLDFLFFILTIFCINFPHHVHFFFIILMLCIWKSRS